MPAQSLSSIDMKMTSWGKESCLRRCCKACAGRLVLMYRCVMMMMMMINGCNVYVINKASSYVAIKALAAVTYITSTTMVVEQ